MASNSDVHDPFYTPHDDLIYKEQQRILAEAANIDRNPSADDFEEADSFPIDIDQQSHPASSLIETPPVKQLPIWRPPPLRIPKDRDDEEETDDEDDEIDKEKAALDTKLRCCCCTMKTCVISTFSMALVLGLIMYFLFPRVPGIQIAGIFDDPSGTHVFDLSHPQMYVWQMSAVANLTVNNPNYIPWYINGMDVVLRDLVTGQQVGSAELYSYNLPAQAYVAVSVPVKAQYLTSNLTDATLRNLVAACSNNRPALPVRFIMNFNVAGLSLFGNSSMELQSTWSCPPSVSVQDPLGS